MAMREGQNLSAKKCFRTSKSDKIRKRIMLCCSPKGVNGMIEIIYKEDQKKSGEKDRFFRIPNNIRQIGEIRGHQKIYIEDYAYTFLKKISRNGAGEGQAAILLGQYHWSEGCAYLFIRSALQIDDMEVSPDHLAFTDKVWGQIYEEEKKYFPEQEIVGWFVSLPGFNMEISEGMLKTHLNHFAGNDKTLFVMEPGEREEAFFLYEGGRLTRQPGFYIYYEKNEAMQAYMIEKSQNKSIEETEKIPDRAVVDFRKAKKEKEQEAAAPAKKRVVWMAGACTAAAVLAVGITFFNSYQGMENTMGTLLEGNSSAGEDMAAAEAGAGVQENPDAAGQTDSAGEDTPAAETPQDAGVQEGASGADETAEDQSGQNTASLTDGAEAAGSSTGGADGSGTAGSAADGSDGAGAADSAADGADGSGTVGSASAGADGSGTAGSAADGSDGTGTGDSASSSGNSGGTDSAGLTSSSDAADGTDAAASGSQSQVLISPEALNPDNTQQETTVSGSASGVRQYTIRRGDTLSSICEAQYGTIARIDEVCRLNGISPEDIIYAGQKILLPE